MAISCRFCPALESLFDRLGYSQEQRAEAVRLAALELVGGVE
jgi:hypothetical protein